METTTSFDLNRAIQQWRESLAQSPAIRAENLDELETHLRDSVATLQARELSAEEAFLIATKRVGSGAVLGKEFGKVNSQTNWIERIVWALVIISLWGVINRFATTCGMILTQIASYLPTRIYSTSLSPMDVWFNLIAFSVMPTIILILLSLLAWKYCDWRQGLLAEKLEGLLSRPLYLAIILLVINFSVEIVSLLSSKYFFGVHEFAVWFYFRSLPYHLFYSGVVFVLARKRLLRKA